MTTPNEDSAKNKKTFRRFMESELKPAGFTEEEFLKFVEKTSKNNPAKNPRNPWVMMAMKEEKDI